MSEFDIKHNEPGSYMYRLKELQKTSGGDTVKLVFLKLNMDARSYNRHVTRYAVGGNLLLLTKYG